MMPINKTWDGRVTPGPWEPPAYAEEVDPDPTVLDLEVQVERLRASLARWGQHPYTCPASRSRTHSGCTCGFREALDDTLWDNMGGDNANIETALARLED